jgi:hypothetical protein
MIKKAGKWVTGKKAPSIPEKRCFTGSKYGK